MLISNQSLLVLEPVAASAVVAAVDVEAVVVPVVRVTVTAGPASGEIFPLYGSTLIMLTVS